MSMDETPVDRLIASRLATRIGLRHELVQYYETVIESLVRQRDELTAEVARLKPVDPTDGMPLRVEVEGERLLLSIGVTTLAFAFEHGEANNPYKDELGDYARTYAISDPLEFARDVCRAMNDEGEDGSTPLTRFLDAMMAEAVEQGSLGVADPDIDAAEVERLKAQIASREGAA